MIDALPAGVTESALVNALLGAVGTLWVVGCVKALTSLEYGRTKVEEMMDLPPDPLEDSILGIGFGLLILIILVGGISLYVVSHPDRLLGVTAAILFLLGKRVSATRGVLWFRNVYQTTCRVSAALVWLSLHGLKDLLVK